MTRFMQEHCKPIHYTLKKIIEIYRKPATAKIQPAKGVTSKQVNLEEIRRSMNLMSCSCTTLSAISFLRFKPKNGEVNTSSSISLLSSFNWEKRKQKMYKTHFDFLLPFYVWPPVFTLPLLVIA